MTAPRYHTDMPLPHPGSCEGCTDERACNVCGESWGGWGSAFCTNGRCAKCHDKHCVTTGRSDAHGFGAVAAEAYARARKLGLTRDSS